MHSADAALRFSAVFAVAGFIIMAASLFEIDRREKSNSETVTANFTEIGAASQNAQWANSYSQ
jgi:hypothetical protein